MLCPFTPGEIETYSGGGYVAEIFPKWNNKAILDNLKQRLWLDRHTRGVYFEFGIFNGGTNYFDSVNILFEFPPYGGVIKYHYVTTFRLFAGTHDWSFMILLAEGAFLVFTVLFLVREGRQLYLQKPRKYFTQFWNMVETSIIILCFLTIIITIYKDFYRISILERLPGKTPDVYINLQYASLMDMTLLYSFSLICFFIVLKFIKLLRFNKRISMLSRTLNRCSRDLLIFGFQFLLSLMAFTFSGMLILTKIPKLNLYQFYRYDFDLISLFCIIHTIHHTNLINFLLATVGTLLFGKDLYGYKDNWSTFASVIRLILGKFDFAEFANADYTLGPIWFNMFHLGINFVIMNMYISILNDAISTEFAELGSLENEFEVVDYMMNSFKREYSSFLFLYEKCRM